MEHDGSAVLAAVADRARTFVTNAVVAPITSERDHLLINIIAATLAFGVNRLLIYPQYPYSRSLGVVEPSLKVTLMEAFSPISIKKRLNWLGHGHRRSLLMPVMTTP
ncbi:hypothetical protein CFII68_08268 [Pseudomonas sp. CFII68]|nr:hypothetical protein CFII68_08268 [Pseudomonas sp. CFII68]